LWLIGDAFMAQGDQELLTATSVELSCMGAVLIKKFAEDKKTAVLFRQ